ncbi:hypothetical protein [Cryobacterium sp. TMT2-15-1]|nr:hypothetical protein [Cryobacterium sp. TMT2-15-1]
MLVMEYLVGDTFSDLNETSDAPRAELGAAMRTVLSTIDQVSEAFGLDD